jgi:hypothetical protein
VSDNPYNESLTARQREFVRLVCSGESPTLTDAYRRAFDTQGKPSTVRTEASRMWRKPHVVAAVERWRKQSENDEKRRRVGETQRIRAKLWDEVECGEKATDRIAALRLLAQASAMLVDRVETTTVEESPAELIASLEATLESALKLPEVLSGAEVDKKLH